MPINACTINSFTINGFACLQPMPVRLSVSDKGHQYHSSVDYAAYIARMKERSEEVEKFDTEGPNINVSITLNGLDFSTSIDRDELNITPMIFVSGINVTEDSLIEAKIGNIEIISGGKIGNVEDVINNKKNSGENKGNV